MPKKKSDGYTSKGLYSNVSKDITKAVRRDLDSTIKMNHVVSAWRKGLNPWITINNPNKNETNKRYIKIKSNISWGNPNRVIPTGKTTK
jgi:hypothetical protein